MTSNHANCAKEIRLELKKAYPRTTFSVRSDSYSGGSSVRIEWTDGPTTKQVESIVDKYEYGTFDGMTDCYNYDKTDDSIPQVQYVQTQRNMSDTTKQDLITKHNAEYVEECRIGDLNAWNKGFNCWNSSVLYRSFNETSFEVQQ